jgi:hypothetical protein
VGQALSPGVGGALGGPFPHGQSGGHHTLGVGPFGQLGQFGAVRLQLGGYAFGFGALGGRPRLGRRPARHGRPHRNHV